jgi:hypothetical protein
MGEREKKKISVNTATDSCLKAAAPDKPVRRTGAA